MLLDFTEFLFKFKILFATKLQQLSGAKQQQDEPDEVERIEKEMSDIKAEIEKLKAS